MKHTQTYEALRSTNAIGVNLDPKWAKKLHGAFVYSDKVVVTFEDTYGNVCTRMFTVDMMADMYHLYLTFEDQGYGPEAVLKSPKKVATW